MPTILELPSIPRTTPPQGERELIPWIVRSLLHSRGVDTATLTADEFAALSQAKLDQLAESLAAPLTIQPLASAVWDWAGGFRASLRSVKHAA